MTSGRKQLTKTTLVHLERVSPNPYRLRAGAEAAYDSMRILGKQLRRERGVAGGQVPLCNGQLHTLGQAGSTQDHAW